MQNHKTKSDLLSLLPTNLKNNEVILATLESCYEGNTRHVIVGDGTTKFGYTFPIQPEILYDLMVECKDKVVLELAAAGGENALFLGLSGAKSVYVNDIAEPEMRNFESRLKSLPSEVVEKFHLFTGDCFKVFASEDFSGKFDVIYARNFYHFFLGEKKKALNALLVRLLKPGGKLILTANSSNSSVFESGDNFNKTHPDAYIFRSDTPLLRSSLQTGNDKISIKSYKVMSSEEGEKQDPLSYEFKPLCMHKKGQILVTEFLNELEPNVKSGVIDFMTTLTKSNGIYLYGNGIRRMDLNRDFIEVHRCVSVAYSRKTFPKQFIGSGLIVAKTISTNVKGHTVEDDNMEVSITIICIKNR